MALIDRLWLATATHDKDDAGTAARRLNLTINIDGEDVLDHDFTFMKGTSTGFGPRHSWLGRNQCRFPGAGRLDEYVADWRFLDAGVPFTRGDLISNGEFRIRAIGSQWNPMPGNLFVYGLDTPSGRPNAVVPLG